MSKIKVIIDHNDIKRVNALWNESNSIELTWEFPRCGVNPMLTTSMSSPWYILAMSFCSTNICEVPEQFLKIMNENEIRYLPEEEYYEKQESYPK